MISVFLAVYSGIASSVKYTWFLCWKPGNSEFPISKTHLPCIMQWNAFVPEVRNINWNVQWSLECRIGSKQVTWERVFDSFKIKNWGKLLTWFWSYLSRKIKLYELMCVCFVCGVLNLSSTPDAGLWCVITQIWVGMDQHSPEGIYTHSKCKQTPQYNRTVQNVFECMHQHRCTRIQMYLNVGQLVLIPLYPAPSQRLIRPIYKYNNAAVRRTRRGLCAQISNCIIHAGE